MTGRFFLKKKSYVIELSKEFNTSSKFSGFKPNNSNCELLVFVFSLGLK